MTKNFYIISKKPKNIFPYLKDLLWNKHLIYQIAKKEFITAYTQSLLGPFYHALVPLLQTIIFNFFLNNLDFSPSGSVPSFIFYFMSICVWNLFASNSIKVSNIYITNRKYISKIHFNRFALVVASSFINSIHFLINFLILVFILLFSKYYYNVESVVFDIKILILPFILFYILVLSAGIGMIITSLSVRYRDLVFGLVFIFQLLMFISPVLYSPNLLDGNYLSIILINPVTSFLELFRWVFIENYTLTNEVIIINVVTTLIIFFIGLKLFIKTERQVADFL
tara:strand:- start:281 stop:1126 length:846 start_codon:yes stop_codon:yes gene_type:complete